MGNETYLVDWPSLARKVGSLTDEGEHGGTNYARKAIVDLLDPAVITGAVHHFLSLDGGSELACNVLRHLRPPSAMHECHRIFRESDDLEERRLAVALLASIADRTVLEWLDELTSDPDIGIQSWGIRVLLELVYEDYVEEHEVEPWLQLAESHTDESILDMAVTMRRQFAWDRGEEWDEDSE